MIWACEALILEKKMLIHQEDSSLWQSYWTYCHVIISGELLHQIRSSRDNPGAPNSHRCMIPVGRVLARWNPTSLCSNRERSTAMLGSRSRWRSPQPVRGTSQPAALSFGHDKADEDHWQPPDKSDKSLCIIFFFNPKGKLRQHTSNSPKTRVSVQYRMCTWRAGASWRASPSRLATVMTKLMNQVIAYTFTTRSVTKGKHPLTLCQRGKGTSWKITCKHGETDVDAVYGKKTWQNTKQSWLRDRRS